MPAVARKKFARDKVVADHRSLGAILSGLMAQGKSVVLTNGVYDLLHVGHVRCLEDARSRGDFLVVAVNADAAVARLKGKGLPIVPAEERMEVLAGLGCVDYVTSFAEDTADTLLRALRPSLYAKGTEYTLKTLPERETLKELDIKAVFVGDKKAHGTSEMIQRIRKAKLA